MKKKLYRSTKDKKLAGVCAGFAEFLGIDATFVRLLFAFFVLWAGTGILAYIVCAIVIPEAPETPDGYTPYSDVND